jgi:hypothetical protein
MNYSCDWGLPPCFQLFLGGPTGVVSPTIAKLTDGKWHLITGTYDGSNSISLYRRSGSRDVGFRHNRSSRRDHITGGSLPSPALYPYRQFAEVGGLLSYGSVILDNYRRAASYVDCILKGAKPSDLPVQASVKFEMVHRSERGQTLQNRATMNRR